MWRNSEGHWYQKVFNRRQSSTRYEMHVCFFQEFCRTDSKMAGKSVKLQQSRELSYLRWPILVSDLSRCLWDAGVPNVVFDWYAFSMYGVRTGFGGASFVIPDDHIQRASAALTAASCPPSSIPDHKPVQPALYLDASKIWGEPSTDDNSINFYIFTQSQALPRTLPLSKLPLQPSNDFIQVSSLPEGTEKTVGNKGMIWIPSLHVLMKAWVLLAIRAGVEEQDEKQAWYWESRYMYAVRDMQQQGLWNDSIAEEIALEDENLTFLKTWMHRDGKGGRASWDNFVAKEKRTSP